MDLNFQFPEKLFPVLNSSARFIVLYGGRVSSKSHTVARILILKALNEKCLILCTRHIQKSIAASSYSLLVKIIKEYGLDKYFHIVENEIRCLRTGAKFIFQGLWQNLDNITSLEGINYCWVEEAKAVQWTAWDKLLPTVRAEGSQFFITFNPDLKVDPVYDMFIIHNRPNALVIKINYNENPFISDTSKKEIEYMRLDNPDKFKWVYEGNTREQSEASILTNIMIHNFEIDTTKQPFYGLDFGYNDPTAITQSYIYDNELFICREFYETNLDPDQLRSKCLGLEWLHGKHLIADSARPELIKMLNATGRFTVQNARKNIGQPIREGAYKYAMSLYLKQFRKIHIHEANCPNACREFPLWKWQTDKNEKILDIVEDGDDHTIDCTIYALERKAAEWYKNYFKQG